jgi:tyrosyl-tRNA synthetase
MNFLNELQERGLVYQTTDINALEKRLESPITLYAGFDPTASSFHVGNLVIILTLKRFQLAGHKVIALVGGGTGLIGDPSGKADERTLNPEELVEEWTQSLRNQLERFLDFRGEQAAILASNFDWLGSTSALDFLTNTGKNFPVNYMLAKDSVSARIQQGISYTEFAYMALQAHDFVKLNELYNCELQIGGSDQWGNITAGTELYRRTNSSNKQIFGLSIPLLLKCDGSKFGKSEQGAIWLDADKTSVTDFYNFWLNADDNDVERLLKIFTFLPLEEITRIVTNKELAKKVLADEVTKIVHG